MDEKRQDEDVALFRYGVIAPLIGKKWKWGARREQIERLCSHAWTGPDGDERIIPEGTIKDWLRKYQRLGFDGLYPRKRSDRGRCRRLTAAQVQKLLAFRRHHPKLAVVELYEMMVINNFIEPGEVSIPTLHRLFRVHKASRRDLARVSECKDLRPFQFAHRNECWQVDVMHGPRLASGGRKHKTYLIAFIDDSTRIVPAAIFVRSENSSTLANVFSTALRRRGIPSKLYADNGRIFKSRGVKLACAKLGIEQIHSRPRRPEGRGKIERFFRSVRQKFLTPFLSSHPSPDIESLNRSFYQWLDDKYHGQPHRGLNGLSPLDAWVQDEAVVRDLHPSMNLENLFLAATTRTVRRDCTLYFNNHRFEAPPEYRSRKVVVRYDVAKPADIFLEDSEGNLHNLRLVDCIANKSIRRKRQDEL